MSATGLSEVRDEVEGLDDEALTERFRQLELDHRRVEAEMAMVTAEADQRALYTVDGHRSMKGWLLAHANWSPGRAARMRKLAAAVAAQPEVGEALAAGRIGGDQADELARLHANPRCREHLGDSVDLLLEQAEHFSYPGFRVCTRHWESRADADGAHRDREQSVERRAATVTELGGGLFAQATGGSPVDTEEMVKIFDHFVEREFHADVAERTRLHGSDAPASLLRRTDAQRRFDAFQAMMRAAIANPEAGEPAGIVVNLVADLATFEFAMAAHGLGHEPDDLPVRDLTERRCQTVGGIPVSFDDLVRGAIHGHVRRAVVNSAGVVVKGGRLRRLYTSAMRELAGLMGHECNHPGCTVKASLAQIDHLDEWGRDDGQTDLDNSGILCGAHNRFKHRAGITVKRDRRGRLYTFRAHGTPLLPVGRTPATDEDFLTDRELVRRRLFANLSPPAA